MTTSSSSIQEDLREQANLLRMVRKRGARPEGGRTYVIDNAIKTLLSIADEIDEVITDEGGETG